MSGTRHFREGRGTGWIGHGWDEITEAAKRASSALHLGSVAGRALPDETYLAKQIWVVNQADSEACFPWMCERMSYAFDGVKRSAVIPWYYARLRDAGGGAVTNVGVTAASGLHAIREHGSAPLGVGPENNYFDEPPAIARQMAQKANLDLVPVWGTGAEVVSAICGALADGLPCGIALQADDAYRNPVGGIVGPEVDSTVAGKRQFLSPGSWGLGFGDNGCVWLDESRVAGAEFAAFARGIS